MKKKINFNHPIITLGSPYGIGYEIFLRSLKLPIYHHSCPVAVGSGRVIQFFQKILQLKFKVLSIDSGRLNEFDHYSDLPYDFVLINIDQSDDFILNLVSISDDIDGRIAYQSIKTGALLVKNGYFKSVVTLPVSKKNINRFDPNFIGHTEFFCDQWEADLVFMTFISRRFNVILLTTHLSLKDVSRQITPNLVKSGLIAAGELKKRLGLVKRICFLGLNPHAGENGLLGQEELWIKEIINEFNQQNKIKIDGPIPSDTAFTDIGRKKYDLYISCYHDQGLIPFKIFSFKDGVNLSFGMKYIRTSVDHGTAVDIIGKKKASLKSFINAYNLALKLTR